ncbi:YsnF/AvaK domain-containing protein [Bacillus sp. FJAT-27251]|uniref:YsnF/AvaK domain-containing protein n=1 Tax=Bacillus sp. FJAT-27251 TaxID=1684142 RepID=UPI0006A78E2D|nr:YsnF/AvaK domain-containing protein [Bacillus sp. FJAT-27251]
MKSNIIGVYNSQDEVVEAIQELQNDGYRVQELGIIGRTQGTDSSIENKTGANTLTFSSESENDGLIDNLSNLYEENNDGRTTEKFMELGMTKDEAREYVSFVEDGKIILFSENSGSYMDTGNTGAVSGSTLNEDTFNNQTPNASRAGYNFEADSSRSMGVSGQYDSLTQQNDREWKDSQNQSMKLREEELDVNKQQVQAGEVTVHKDVVEEQKTIDVPVSREEVYVEQRKVDGDRMETTSPIGDDETIHIPIRKERVDVNKKSVVTDEVVVGKREVQDTEKVTENLKKEEVRLEGDDRAISENLNDRDNRQQNPNGNHMR